MLISLNMTIPIAITRPCQKKCLAKKKKEIPDHVSYCGRDLDMAFSPKTSSANTKKH